MDLLSLIEGATLVRNDVYDDTTVLLIDGDVMCHIACKDKWQFFQVQRKIPVSERTRTPPKEGYVLTEAEEMKYFRMSWRNLEVHLQTLCEKLFVTDYFVALKSPTNFRDDMYPEYKQQRKNKPNANATIQALRDTWLAHDDRVILAEGREADDFLRIWAKEASNLGINYIIGSIDKDLKCIEGLHYNLKMNEMVTVTPYEALKLYYEQLLKGDPTDNIPGIPRVGDITAAEMLSNCTTVAEFQEEVILAYMGYYGDDWQNYLLSNGKMIHLQETLEDYFNLDNWPLARILRKQDKTVELIRTAEKFLESKKLPELVPPVVVKKVVDVSELKLF